VKTIKESKTVFNLAAIYWMFIQIKQATLQNNL